MIKALRKAVLLIVLLGPLSALIAFTWIAPAVLTTFLSFFDVGLGLQLRPVGLENFYRILYRDIWVPQILQTTVIYVLGVLAINSGFGLVLGILTAYFVKRESVSLFFRTAWLLPRMTPGVLYVVLWMWFVDTRYGLLNAILSMLGLPTPYSWLLSKPHSQIIMIAINGYVGASYGMIIYSAAVKSIPTDFFNAAKVDGASDLQIVRYVILPLLKWPILFVTAWQTLSLLASYEYILMVWGDTARQANVEVWALYTYDRAFWLYDYGYAAALSVFLVAAGLIMIVLYMKIFGFRRLMEPSRVEV